MHSLEIQYKNYSSGQTETRTAYVNVRSKLSIIKVGLVDE